MNYSELKNASKLDHPISFSSQLDIFTHHFPGNPLMPGALSGELLSKTCGGPDWSLIKINGLRFRKPLAPDMAVTISCVVNQESPTEKCCSGKIISGPDVIADGEFVFAKTQMTPAQGSSPDSSKCFMTSAQIREYLPHGEPIVLIDRLVEANYPTEIQEALAAGNTSGLDQSKLVGTKVHTRSTLNPGDFWLDDKILPSPVLSELVAQAGALTLAPFFTGTKPQVSLLGCDTEYFHFATAGEIVDTFVELTRAKRLGKSSNMIIFKGECYIGKTKIANINLNAMASFQ